MKADPPITMYINGVTDRPTLIARVGLAEDVQDLLWKVYRMGVRRGKRLAVKTVMKAMAPAHGGRPMTLRECMEAEEDSTHERAGVYKNGDPR